MGRNDGWLRQALSAAKVKIAHACRADSVYFEGTAIC